MAVHPIKAYHPPDPAHNRAMPTGNALARVLRELFRRQQAEVLPKIQRGQPVNLDHWTNPKVIDTLLPYLIPYYRDGARHALVSIARQSGKRELHAYFVGACTVLQVKDIQQAFDVFNPRILEFIRGEVFHFLDSTNQTSAERLRDLLLGKTQEGATGHEITAGVLAIFGDSRRSQMIAATETSRAMHAGGQLAARDSGVVEAKRWLASSDACLEICLPLNGKEVPLDKPYFVASKPGPYAVVMHPPGHPKCMCSETFVVGRNADKPPERIVY